MAAEGRRRSARRARRPPPPPAREIPHRRAIPISRLGVLLVLLSGFWTGLFVGLLPNSVLNPLSLAIAVLSAVVLAFWYRRRAREYMQRRAASRDRSS